MTRRRRSTLALPLARAVLRTTRRRGSRRRRSRALNLPAVWETIVTTSQWVRTHHREVAAALLFAAGWHFTGSLGFTAFVFALAGVVTVYVWAWRRRRAVHAETGQRVSFPGLIRSWAVEVVRRRQLVRQWRLACQQSGLHTGGKSKAWPWLLGLTATVDGDFTALIKPGRIGLVVTDVMKQTDRIRQIVGCHEVTVTPTGSDTARVAFYWRDSMSRVLPLADMPMGKAGQVAYGVRRDGSPATILQHMSVLIGGLTRHGKSVAAQALLADLVRKKVPVQLYISDPKGGMELSAFSRFVGQQMGTLRVVEYVTDEAGTVAMVKRAHKAMLDRQKTQATKNHTPSPESPLVVILLDELLLLTDMLRKGTAGELGKILFTGAAAGFVVWANTQVGHEAELGRCRDLFPQRLCFATRTSQTTDTILGTGAESLGARCSQLHVAGVGYSSAEHSQTMERFRGALVTPEDAEALSRGEVPKGMTRRTATQHRRWALYRLWSWEDDDGGRRLLYVGITNEPKRRLAEHAKSKPWWVEVDPAATDIVWLQDEATARREEALTIRTELPLHNAAHNTGNPVRRRLRVVKEDPQDTEAVA